MNDYGIYAFSGTGNTQMCAAYLRQELEKTGVNAALHDISKESAPVSEKNLIVCYPIYGFNAPANVLRFCRSVPFGTGNVYFLKTSGEPLHLNDHSSAKPAKILRQKGYRVMGEFHYVMPYNMIFRHSDEMAAKMWQTAKMRIPAAAKIIAAGDLSQKSVPLSAKLMSGLCNLQYAFYPLNGRLFHVKKGLCIQCMQCVKNCPMQNIRFENGKFRFGGKCVCCTRCAFRCPANAMRIGILDFMRVNGIYDFERDPENAVIGPHYAKAYERYFLEEP
jgi:NAD-dependent dihydropyrimidine dehydrogenase PreA subunit